MELTQQHLKVISELIKADKRFEGNESLFEPVLNEAFKRASLIAESVKDEAELAPYLKKLVSTSILLVLKTIERNRQMQEQQAQAQQELIQEPAEEAIEKISTKEEHLNNIESIEPPNEIIEKLETPSSPQEMKLPHEKDDEILQIDPTEIILPHEKQEEQMLLPHEREKLEAIEPEQNSLPHERDNNELSIIEPIENKALNPYNNVIINFNSVNIAEKTNEFAIQQEFLQKIYETLVNVNSTHLSEQYLQLYELRYVRKKTQAQIAKIMNISEQEVTQKLFDLIDAVKTTIS